ncbi:hydrogenase nickel incorporation protein HypB [bacterium]|nr:hydrogenase nickel incorporation protein HypB [bacterium]
MKVVVKEDILKANDTIADVNRKRLEEHGIFVLNMLGSPGSGKTTCLERLAGMLQGRLRMAVVEGDLATSRDAERIEALSLPTVQINTGGGCHLEAPMVSQAIDDLPLQEIDLLVIENVGNLVCTASHKLGEHRRLVVLSATEGDDKITKYPPMFQKTDAVALNKVDLLEFTDFDVERAVADLSVVNPNAPLFSLSARTGQGFEELVQWLDRERATLFGS